MALINNEVGALFVEPKFHGNGIGFALMNKAKQIHGELEVFEENRIGRKFYSRFAFSELSKMIHEPTGNNILRLKFINN